MFCGACSAPSPPGRSPSSSTSTSRRPTGAATPTMVRGSGGPSATRKTSGSPRCVSWRRCGHMKAPTAARRSSASSSGTRSGPSEQARGTFWSRRGATMTPQPTGPRRRGAAARRSSRSTPTSSSSSAASTSATTSARCARTPSTSRPRASSTRPTRMRGPARPARHTQRSPHISTPRGASCATSATTATPPSSSASSAPTTGSSSKTVVLPVTCRTTALGVTRTPPWIIIIRRCSGGRGF
mmetsp:Transcript_7350/g.30440  ORF Transcript_7350/g.30440 Transcript_7350/m.30440 type:complete len:241 (-) Transcript_7350:258-980(-)